MAIIQELFYHFLFIYYVNDAMFSPWSWIKPERRPWCLQWLGPETSGRGFEKKKNNQSITEKV